MGRVRGQTMNFSILGSLDVRMPAGRIAITAPKQRATLATLLLEINNEVPVDRLTSYIWDGKPPASAQTTLQSYIYRLRQSLRPITGVELETGPDSYTLRVDPARTDLWYFRERVSHAAVRAANDDLRDSVRSLRDGLSVWRGSALSGVPGKNLRQEAQYLEDERIRALEELFGAEIALDGHRRVIPELVKLVSVYHFHETFHAQLMLAFYRSGRQAEALQVYLRTRRKLREKLGIEPGPELQELHQAILERRPAGRIVLSWLEVAC
jgi:DNA-binding SARP family transcriptional activator